MGGGKSAGGPRRGLPGNQSAGFQFQNVSASVKGVCLIRSRGVAFPAGFLQLSGSHSSLRGFWSFGRNLSSTRLNVGALSEGGSISCGTSGGRGREEAGQVVFQGLIPGKYWSLSAKAGDVQCNCFHTRIDLGNVGVLYGYSLHFPLTTAW